MRRRIGRRMQVRRTETLDEYLEFFRQNAEEAQALFGDLLISVTTFFRDPVAFKRLSEIVIPQIFEAKDANAYDTIRVWVPGCATGEEAYSIAMLLLEEANRRDSSAEIQVFGSDLDVGALATAREGRYPLAIEADVSEERLRRFFVRESDHYQVTRELRDLMLFSRHSLLKDPPFSKLDLISCRNLLIYLDRELQQQVCATFHFALRPGGHLFIGPAETAENPPGLFQLVEREARIYQRSPATQNNIRLVQTLTVAPQRLEPLPTRPQMPFRSPNEAAAHREALEKLASPSVLVDEAGHILNLSETVGRFLQPPGGPPTNDLAEQAREELRFDLRACLHRAFATGEPVLSPPISVRFNGAERRVYFQVKPFSSDPNTPRRALVTFFEGELLGGEAESGARETHAPNMQLQQMQQELQATQAQLRTTREEYEAANEELRAANEELQSLNEEYRSTAEELETSKEELQSMNEELSTVNSELKNKLENVSRAHSDIQNLITAVDVGILFLDTSWISGCR